ncbi:hypothetical protein KSS87_010651, partial [Heliosperma pusillum]
ETPPWLAKNSDEDSPLSCSLGKDMTTQENIARYLVSQDEHLLRTLGKSKYPSVDQCSTLILDKDHRSIVFIGMQRGFSLLVKQILTSDLPYALSGQNGETPLHYASKCNEQVSRLLLEKHHELIRKVSSSGKTMLDHAVEDGATWLVRLMLTQEKGTKCTIPYWPRVPWTKACRRLIWHMNEDGDTPLHIAARKGDIEISKLLIQGFKSAFQDEAEDCDDPDDLFEPGYDLMGVNPLYMENLKKDIPLVLALQKKHDDCGVMLSMETFPLVENYSLIPVYIKCLPVAMGNGCLSSAKMILERVISHGLGNLGIRLHGAGIRSPGVRKMADHITAKYPVKQKMIKSDEFEKLLEVLPRFQGETQKDTNTILKEAAERGENWLVRMALECDRNLFTESAPAWRVACEKGHLSTLLIFINLRGHQDFIQLCRDRKQTPLHHIKLLHSEQYVDLLKMPVFEQLKNEIDSDGATPLHRAIQRDDIKLTKALLEIKGIEVSIKDYNDTTALDLLEKRCKLSTTWGKMCREIEQDSTVKKLKHLFRKISFQGMQSSLSVVAALVTTLTFAAGFAVPGGPDSKDGTPVLATKAVFLAFSISNTIAMCCSVMVLFLLLGPMMWDLHPSLFYVNMSLYLLMMSLGGTIMAFMTGTYAIMSPKTMGDAIFIIVLCSLTLFMACIFWLLTYSFRFKKQFRKIFTRRKKVSGDAWTQSVQSPSIATVSTLQQPPRSSNTPLSQASNDIDLMGTVQSGSSNIPATHAFHNIAANVQSQSSNTSMTQAYGDTTANVQSGISSKPVTLGSSSPLTERQTPGLNRVVGQISVTAHPASDDIKIEIKQS